MLKTVAIDPEDLEASSQIILDAWNDALVVAMRATRPIADVRRLYDELLPRIGTPHFLAEDVRQGSREIQRTGELWFEVRYDPAFPDAYRHSANAQPLHTDGSYIPTFPNATLLCCVTNADEGGETVFIPAEALVAALGQERPALLQRLETVEVPHARSGDRRTHTVIRREHGELRLNWNYYCVDDRDAAEVHALREEFFAFLRDSPAVRAAIVPVKLHPGDAVVWKDDRVLHGRNSFSASKPSARFIWKCAVNVGVFGASA